MLRSALWIASLYSARRVALLGKQPALSGQQELFQLNL